MPVSQVMSARVGEPAWTMTCVGWQWGHEVPVVAVRVYVPGGRARR